ncbi:hypothetical protein DVH24_019926 [Malus domestica]|uniref:Uncharacterized protein n=1 Tax=Malus domestica TaxID=3750 RepID=A0A498HZM6_MALDO|nr:hypothetical protein DVH24_019926 [Malus domestica]
MRRIRVTMEIFTQPTLAKGKETTESLIKSSIELDTFNSQSVSGHTSRTKSRAAARSDIITRRVKGRKLVVELTSQSGVT